jgi:hypothetical protein
VVAEADAAPAAAAGAGITARGSRQL